MEELLAAVWAVCRFPSRNSVDTDPAEPPAALAVSADAAAAARAAVVCASAEIPSESAAARISATPGTPRRSARRCAVADCAGASAGILFVPSWASVDSARWDRA